MVTLPDTTQWSFNLRQLSVDAEVSLEDSHGDCAKAAIPSNLGASYSGTITHPSGLIGTFTVRPVKHGRSYVYKECWGDTAHDADYAITPAAYYSLSLTKKTFSGPGLPTEVWTFAYSDPHESWLQDCATTTSCPTTVWTDVTGPEGSAMRHTFSNRFDISESHLLRTDSYAGAVGTTLLRSEISTYAEPDRGPWPVQVGYNLQSLRLNEAQTTQLAPVSRTDLQQDGVAASTVINSFDALARPLSVTRSNPSFSRTDVTAYYDDADNWVLGQVAQVTNANKGIVVSQSDYDPTTALPIRAWSFGKLQMSMTYNTDGTLSTSVDGNSHTTRFSNWKRGLPQLITHADGTWQSAVVDDLGLIRSTTDENGYTTAYDYDAIGRMKSVTPPEGNPTCQVFEPVTSNDYGLAAGHWRQTTTTGNERKVEHFDALWRPVVSQEEDVGNSSATMRLTIKRYDAESHVVFASYPRNPANDGWVNYDTSMPGVGTRYDALGRTTQVTEDSELGPLTTTTEYLSGAQTRVTSPRHYQTTTGYFFLDEPRYDQPVWIVAPEGARTDIVRDVFGKPTSVTRSKS